jgi:hypothetical protein
MMRKGEMPYLVIGGRRNVPVDFVDALTKMPDGPRDRGAP